MLALVEFELNETVHNAHGKSLFTVVYEKNPFLPIEHVFSNPHDYKVHTVTKLIQDHNEL